MISGEQLGFLSKTDTIFALRSREENYREKQKELHRVFIDLEKANDRFPKEGVWFCIRDK